MERHRNRIVGDLAAGQHGVVARRQLITLGLTDTTIGRWVATGRLHTAAPEVYVVAGAPPTWRQRLLVAVLSQGPLAVASHRAAARLWRLIDGDDVRLEVTAPRHLRRRRDLVVHETDRLPPDQRTAVENIPTTTIARTLIDLCAVLRPAQASLAYDAALRRQLVTPQHVDRAIGAIASRGRRGITVARVLTERPLGHLPTAAAVHRPQSPPAARCTSPRRRMNPTCVPGPRFAVLASHSHHVRFRGTHVAGQGE
jgi:hypothetical protein